MFENQETIIKLLEKKVILLIRDIDIQREREYMQIKNLKNEIRNFYNNYYSHNEKYHEAKLVKKLENLILIIEKES